MIFALVLGEKSVANADAPSSPSIGTVTEHLTMNTVIHAAVRRDLARSRQALNDFPAGSQQRAAQLNAAWQNLDGQLYHHHPVRRRSSGLRCVT